MDRTARQVAETLNHYMGMAFRAAGLGWDDDNKAEMQDLAEAIADLATEVAQHIDLDAIRAREAAATEGQWTIWRDEDDVDNSVISTDQRWFEDGGHRYYGSRQIAVLAEGNLNEADAEFIAHARTDVPALLAEIERLRGGGA